MFLACSFKLIFFGKFHAERSNRKVSHVCGRLKRD